MLVTLIGGIDNGKDKRGQNWKRGDTSLKNTLSKGFTHRNDETLLLLEGESDPFMELGFSFPLPPPEPEDIS